MAESGGSGEKTEQPTSKKIRDAREKGQVAQSKELTMISAISTLVIAMGMNYKYIIKQFAINREAVMKAIEGRIIHWGVLMDCLAITINTMINVIALPIILAAVVSFFVNLFQINGLLASKEFFKFDIQKLNPVSNFKSIFGLKNFIKFLRQMLEMTVMTVVAFYMFRNAIVDLVNLYYYSFASVVGFLAMILAKIFAVLLGIHFCFTIFDFVMEKRNLHKQLMMSMQELKDEYKNTEGNPEIKSKRKELQQELMEDGGFDGVLSNSTLVLANPTHKAIIILYSPKRFLLPVLMFKAEGEKALFIFNLAKKLEVPVIRDKWLARQLFEIGEVGKFVPDTLLKSVADIIGKNLHLLPVLARELAEVQKPQAGAPPAGVPPAGVVKPVFREPLGKG